MRSPHLSPLLLVAACASPSAAPGPTADASIDTGVLAANDAGADAPAADATAIDGAPPDATPAEAATPSEGGTGDDAGYSCPGDGGVVDVWCDRVIATGVVWRSRTSSSLFCGAQRVNVVDVDLTQPGVSARPVRGAGGAYETVSSMGARTGAVAGINGGFFCNGSDDICTLNAAQPTCNAVSCNGSDLPASGPCTEPTGLSLLAIDGGTVSTNCKTARATLSLDASGRTPSIGLVNAGDGPTQPNAIGAGPLLVAPPDAGSGPGIADVDDEAFHWPCTTHPRTAVAIDHRGHLLLVTFDGGNGATGVTLAQAATFLVTELGARQAMNFDGGGSTTLYVKGHSVANVPSTDGADGAATERAVYDGLFVYAP